jgi:hypothetical protein
MTAGTSPQRIAQAALAVLGLLLASCGPKAPAGDAATKDAADGAGNKAIIEAAADPCTTLSGGYGQALCGDPDLSPLVGKIKSDLVEAAAAISPEGAQQLAQGQSQWMESTRITCGIGEGKAPLSADQESCVKSQLQARTQAADSSVQREGGFVFQTVEINRATALPADASDLTDLGVYAVTKEIKFPRIEGDSPQIRRFNELMQQRPQRGVQEQTSEVVDYKIAYAGPELVSVRFSMMENAVGSAHPSDSEKVVTVVMGTGELLKETDVFAAPPARWRAELVRRVRADLLKQIRDRGGAPELPEAELVDTAVKTKNWVITEDALVILFPSESIGPRVLGSFEVKILWKDIASLLNPAGPGPIGAARR